MKEPVQNSSSFPPKIQTSQSAPAHANNHIDWYRSAYPGLTQYGLWLRGGEINALAPEEFGKRIIRALFVRLSTYHDTAASFTHLLLYERAAKNPDVFPDLAYLPPENDARAFDRNRIPWLIGTQTKYDARAFSFIGFSNSIVQELINIPRFLVTSRIPLSRKERLGREDIPLIVLGGANAIHTSSLWGEDSWVDGIFTGHNTRAIDELFSICVEGKKKGLSKQDTLKALERVDGFYQSNAIIKKPALEHPPKSDDPLRNGLVLYSNDAIGAGHLQINEGCRGSCSFCAENWARKPYRELDPQELIKYAAALKKDMGLEKINIFSFNFNMHTHFYRLIWDLIPLFRTIGLKSQRFDMLAIDDTMIACQCAVGKTTFSAGIEGISPRLRRLLNKNLDEDVLVTSIDLIFRARARELKIFLLTTGIECAGDYTELRHLADAIDNARRRHGAKTRVIFSITPLVKFPWTPLEFDDAALPEAHAAAIAKISEIVRERGFEARAAIEPREYHISQILARAADGRIKTALLEAAAKTHFTYYSQITPAFYNAFMHAIQKQGLDPSALLAGSTLEESVQKPWASLDTGISRKFLWETFRTNKFFKEIGAPLHTVAIERPPHEAREYREKAEDMVRHETIIEFSVSLHEADRGLPRFYIGTALGRALMKSDPELIQHFRAYHSAYWSHDRYGQTWMTGDDIISLRWDRRGLEALKADMKSTRFIKKLNSLFAPWGTVFNLSPETPPECAIFMESSYRFDPASFLKAHGLKHTLFKEASGIYRMEFSKDSVKKNIIRGCEYSVSKPKGADNDMLIKVTLVPGEKFDYETFARETFICPKRDDWVRIKARAQFIKQAPRGVKGR